MASNNIPDPLLARSEVERIVGLKRSAIYDRMQRGTFPQPERFRDSRRVRWRRSKIDKWLQGQLVS